METVEMKTPAALKEKEECTKMLGAHVSLDLYWEFKQEVAKRQENMADAIAHAARMYIDATHG